MKWKSEQNWILLEKRKESGFQQQSTATPSLILKTHQQTKAAAIYHASFFLSILILKTEYEHNLEYRVVVWIDYKKFRKHWLQWWDTGGKRKEKTQMVSSLRSRRTEWHGLKQRTRQGASLGQKWWIPLWIHWLGSGRKPSREVRTQCRDLGLREKILGEWMMTEGSVIGKVPWGTAQTGDERQPRENPEDCHF